jgi:hypothetical protein
MNCYYAVKFFTESPHFVDCKLSLQPPSQLTKPAVMVETHLPKEMLLLSIVVPIGSNKNVSDGPDLPYILLKGWQTRGMLEYFPVKQTRCTG